MNVRKDAPKISRYSLLTGLTRQTIIPFFQRTFLRQLCILTCGETTCSISQPRYVFNSPNERYTRIFSTLKQGTLQLFFTSGNKKNSQEERSGEYVGYSICCPSFSFRKSTVVAAVCILALSWWRKRPQSCLWAVLVPNFKDLQEKVMPILIHIDSQSVLKRNGGDAAPFSKETGTRFLLCTA